MSVLGALQNRVDRALQWSERYTGTDMRYLASGGFWLTLDQVAGAVVALVLSIAFAHLVPKEEYGTYRYLLSLFWTLAAFTLTGLPTAISQAIARGYDGVYKRSFITSYLWGMPMAAIALGMGIYYGLQGNVLLAIGSAIIALFGPLMQPAYLFGALLVGKKDFRRNAIFGIYLNLAPALLLFALMFFTRNPLVFFAAYLIGNVATGAILCILSARAHPLGSALNDDFHHLTRHFSAMNLLTTIAQQIDKLVVFHFLGAAQLAVYSFAIAMPEQIKGVFNSVSTLALPKFAERPVSEIMRNFWGRLFGLTGFLALAGLAYIILAPFFFRLLFPAYLDAIVYSQVFAISLLFVSNTVPVTLLQAHAAKRELYLFNIFSPVIQIVTLIVFTALWGIMGTVLARVFARAWSLLLASLLAQSYSRRS